mmetsp:Transcript_2114/g.3094  ORF Transcript_2114/g.3094 Transcript_2114/m.3094 type:complete len:146 (+) Transcript_2114:113-550(+)
MLRCLSNSFTGALRASSAPSAQRLVSLFHCSSICEEMGTVKWFNFKKGYGFIIGDDTKQYFAHFQEVKRTGFKALVPFERVTFDVQETEKGLCATNIGNNEGNELEDINFALERRRSQTRMRPQEQKEPQGTEPEAEGGPGVVQS